MLANYFWSYQLCCAFWLCYFYSLKHIVYLLARMMWRNRQVAFVSSLIYLSMFLVFSVGTYSVLDPMLALWVTASMVCCFFGHLKPPQSKNTNIGVDNIRACLWYGIYDQRILALVIPVIVDTHHCYQKQFTQMFPWFTCRI